MNLESVLSIKDLLLKLDILKNKYTRTKIVSWDFSWSEDKPYAEFGYRGVSNCSYKLLPRALNKSLCKVYDDNFDSPVYRFRNEASGYLRNTCGGDHLLWMQYAQHYGVPTRLLDFSQNPLVALYFACQNLKVDGAMWIINVDSYDCVTTIEYMEKHNIRSWKSDEHLNLVLNSMTPKDIKPIYFIPEYIDVRMNAQASRFMLWPNQRFDFEKILKPRDYMDFNTDSEQNQFGEFALKLIIPKENKKKILEELDLLGINEKNLFPGLDSIGKYVNFLYS